MIKKRNIEYVYITFLLLIWTLYSCYSMFNSEDKGYNILGGFSPLLSVFSFVISLLYLLVNYVGIFCKKKHGKMLLRWIVYFLYVSLVVLLLSGNANINSIIYNQVQVMLPMMVMLVMYLYIRRNGITEFFLTTCLCVFFILVVQYFRLYSILNTLIDAHIGGAYYPVFLLPVVLMNNSNKVKLFVVVITFIVLLSSLKRGGIVAFGLGVLTYLICYNMISNKQRIKGLFLAVFAIAILIVVFLWMNTYNSDSIIERFYSIQEDEGSGRIDVWKQTWFMIVNSSASNFLFGHGYSAVLRDSPLFLSAHNDLLEILYDYGFICLLLFIGVLSSWIRLIQNLYTVKDALFPHLAMLLVIVVVFMTISHVLIYPWMLWVCLCLGVFMGQIDRNKTI